MIIVIVGRVMYELGGNKWKEIEWPYRFGYEHCISNLYNETFPYMTKYNDYHKYMTTQVIRFSTRRLSK